MPTPPLFTKMFDAMPGLPAGKLVSNVCWLNVELVRFSNVSMSAPSTVQNDGDV